MTKICFRKKQKHTYLRYLSLILIPAIYCTSFIWQGLDVTDTGFHLTQQKYIIHGIKAGWPLNWPVDLVIGFLLQPFATLGLLGARLAWVTLMVCNTIIIYIIFRKKFPQLELQLLVISLFAMVVISSRDLNILQYYNIPAFTNLLVAVLLFFFVSSSTDSGLNKPFFISFVGCLAALNGFLRLPNLAIILIPLMALLLNSVLDKKNIYAHLKNQVIFFTAFSFSAIILFFLLYSQNLHLQYIDSLFEILKTRKSSINVYFKQLFSISEFMFYWFLLLGFGVIFLSKLKKLQDLKKVLVVSFTLAVCCLAIFSSSGATWIHVTSFVFLFLLAPPILCCLFKKTEFFTHENILLAFSSFCLMVSAFAGSSGGMKKIIYGMWFSLPVAVIFFNHTMSLFKNELNTLGISKRELIFYVFLIIGFISIGAVKDQFTNSYRDSANRLTMTTAVDHPLLYGVLTTKGRAKSIEEILFQIEKLTNKDDSILVYNSAPLLYYLTGRKPSVRQNWLVVKNITKKKIDYLFEDVCKESPSISGLYNSPKIVVKAVTNTRNRNWGGTSVPALRSKSYWEALGWVEANLERCNLRLVWSNSDFEIYKPRL